MCRESITGTQNLLPCSLFSLLHIWVIHAQPDILVTMPYMLFQLYFMPSLQLHLRLQLRTYSARPLCGSAPNLLIELAHMYAQYIFHHRRQLHAFGCTFFYH